MVDVNKPDERDDADDSGGSGMGMEERDKGLAIIRDEIAEYLKTHNEGDLETIEMRFSCYLIANHSTFALMVWDMVNQHRELFGLEVKP